MRLLRRPTVSLPTLTDIRTRYPISSRGSLDGAPGGKWNNPDVRGAVYAIGGRVCGYCQRAVSDSRGDVEHYRPKSEYPWLIYDYKNYLISCRICNSSRKSKRFPIAGRAKRLAFKKRMATDEQFLRRALGQEKRLLLDPFSDPVEEWIDVDYENQICRIILTPAAMNDKRAKQMGEETIEFFGFNTISELIDDRLVFVNATLDTIEEWRKGDLTKVNVLRTFANRYKPHGWAVRRVAAALAPTIVLPSAEEDLHSYVRELLNQLDTDDYVLGGMLTARDREMAQGRKEEKCWTLAVLWKDPPAASPAIVGTWITERKRAGEIDAFREQL